MPVIASRKRGGRATVVLLGSLLGGLLSLTAPARAEPLQWYTVPAPTPSAPSAGPAAHTLPAPIASGAPSDAADSAAVAAAMLARPTAPPALPSASPPAVLASSRASRVPAKSAGPLSAMAALAPALTPAAGGAGAALAAAPQYDALVTEAARRHALDPLLVHAVVAAESAYRPAVVSPKGAVGLMQVMPATGARFGKTGLSEPRENLEAGTAYLGWLMQHFGGRLDLALAGYNAGEGAVARYGNVVPPYAETQAYVRKVLTHYASLRGERPNGALANLPYAPPVGLVPIRSAAPVAPSAAKSPATGGLGDVGQWVQLFTGGPGRAHATATPRL